MYNNMLTVTQNGRDCPQLLLYIAVICAHVCKCPLETAVLSVIAMEVYFEGECFDTLTRGSSPSNLFVLRCWT